METDRTKLKDVEWRVGLQGVFSHCGDCEHVFFITQIRELLSIDKVDDENPIKVLSYGIAVPYRNCQMCGTKAATNVRSHFAVSAWSVG